MDADCEDLVEPEHQGDRGSEKRISIAAVGLSGCSPLLAAAASDRQKNIPDQKHENRDRRPDQRTLDLGVHLPSSSGR